MKDDALSDYNMYCQEYLKRTVWSGGCRSWYKNGKVDGPVTAMYPGSTLHYKEMLEATRWEDFDYEYTRKNRFAFMGNGLSAREEREGEDLSFYLES